jgi:hypothetical protein
MGNCRGVVCVGRTCCLCCVSDRSRSVRRRAGARIRDRARGEPGARGATSGHFPHIGLAIATHQRTHIQPFLSHSFFPTLLGHLLLARETPLHLRDPGSSLASHGTDDAPTSNASSMLTGRVPHRRALMRVTSKPVTVDCPHVRCCQRPHSHPGHPTATHNSAGTTSHSRRYTRTSLTNAAKERASDATRTGRFALISARSHTSSAA